MNMSRGSLALLMSLSFSLPLLGACSPGAQPPASTQPAGSSTAATAQPQTALGRMVDKGVSKARAELNSGNLDINDGFVIRMGDDKHPVNHDAKLPKAQITPQGDLLIEGKAVAVTADQRALLLDYRTQMIDIAEAGMAIGVQGADLAGKAISEVVAGVFSGNTEQLDKRMEAEGKHIEAQARQLCALLGPTQSTQQQLAASLPAFKPYATMTQADIDDCMDEGVAVTHQ